MSLGFRISVGANIVLLGAVAVLLWRDPPADRMQVRAAAQPSAAARQRGPAPVSVRDQAGARAEGSRLTPALVAQLAQAGLSRDVLVSAVREDFNRRWDQRMRELEKRYAPRQVPEREYIELARERDAAQVRELKGLLGEDGYRAWDKEQTLQAVNGAGLPMTDEEAEQAYRLQKEFDEKHKELQMAMEDGVADRADAATLQTQAYEALQRDLEQLFGRDRLDAMRGISDPVANVQWRYGELHPTPDQARAVVGTEDEYRTREAALAAQLKGNAADMANVTAQLKALSDARDENLRRIFGADAYESAKRRNDPTYQTLTQFAQAWDLRAPELLSVYENLHAFHDEAERTRSAAAMREAAGQPVNWREVDAAIEQARQQTEAGLQTLVGAERLHRLKQNGLLTHR